MRLALPRFYASEEEFLGIHRRLKLTPCPFCKRVGTLILHGKLYGYAEDNDWLKACRGRRVLCSNRRKRNGGCGHTFSLWAADTLRRSCLGASRLWTFLKGALRLDNKAKALRDLKAGLSVSSAYRIWNRFASRQSRLRTVLTHHCAPPHLPHSHRPAEQTIAHLETAFPHAACPIVAFQHQLQTAFL